MITALTFAFFILYGGSFLLVLLIYIYLSEMKQEELEEAETCLIDKETGKRMIIVRDNPFNKENNCSCHNKSSHYISGTTLGGF